MVWLQSILFTLLVGTGLSLQYIPGSITGTPALSKPRRSRVTTVKTVMNRGGGYEQVGLRENVSRIPAFFNQQAPRENDILRNLENP